MRIATGISPVRWCYRGNGGNNNLICESAQIKFAISREEPLSWFDELFHGGIFCPETEGGKRAVTVLLTGPPGTGKSTLAMEMCVRLARRDFPNISNKKALYLASEGYPPWIMRNAVSFGMVEADAATCLFDTDARDESKKIQIRAFRDSKVVADPDLLGRIAEILMPGSSAEKRARNPNRIPPATPIPPGVFSTVGLVVIDGLNSVPFDKEGLFQKLHEQLVESGPQLIVMVLDSSPKKPVSEAWEFSSDIVIRLDRDYRSGSHYMVRTIEVLKARYQEHVWGSHQLKVYGNPEGSARKHPFHVEGGIFIFPSLHYILSRLKVDGTPGNRVDPSPGWVTTPLRELNDLLEGGLPKGRTTALVGLRGSHKSHLGLMQVLHNIDAHDGYSLIISLRDDHQFTMKTLKSIFAASKSVKLEQAEIEINLLINSGRLEIAYFTPGYITPEEFFHRLLLSIMRMKETKRPGHAEGPPVFLLFNSLDQIASRFPLCAEEKVFVPAIIQVLASLDVTSVIVAGGLESNDEGLRNLLSMAELIIDFNSDVFPAATIKQKLKRHSALLKIVPAALKKALPDPMRATKITVGRYAGGRAAGARGMLELVELPESGTDGRSNPSPLSGILMPGLQLVSMS